MKIGSRTSVVLWHAGAGLVLAALMVWWVLRFIASTEQGDAFPNRPIHVVVPYGAGGGTDTFVRILQKGIVEDGRLTQPLVIINQAGGSGTIGSREVKDARPDGYKILCHHNALITAKLAGTVHFGPEAFEIIAMTGGLSMVVLVREDAPYPDLPALLEEARRRPREVRFGANQGSPAYFTTLQLEKSRPGAAFSIVSADGGADRYAKILGGHLDAGIFSLSEYLDFRGGEGTPPERNIRALALLSPERHEAIPEVPTSGEQDIGVFLTNANYWWAPKGTPGSVQQHLARALEQALKNEQVRTELRRIRVDPVFLDGEPLLARIEDTVDRFAAVAERREFKLPDFPLHTGLVTGVLFLFVLLEGHLGKRQGTAPADPGLPEGEKRPKTAVACFLVLIAYVLLLQTGSVPFALSTAAMVFIVGGIMSRWERRRWIVLAQLALLTGLGAEFLFTELFTVPLP